MKASEFSSRSVERAFWKEDLRSTSKHLSGDSGKGEIDREISTEKIRCDSSQALIFLNAYAHVNPYLFRPESIRGKSYARTTLIINLPPVVSLRVYFPPRVYRCESLGKCDTNPISCAYTRIQSKARSTWTSCHGKVKTDEYSWARVCMCIP